MSQGQSEQTIIEDLFDYDDAENSQLTGKFDEKDGDGTESLNLGTVKILFWIYDQGEKLLVLWRKGIARFYKEFERFRQDEQRDDVRIINRNHDK